MKTIKSKRELELLLNKGIDETIEEKIPIKIYQKAVEEKGRVIKEIDQLNKELIKLNSKNIRVKDALERILIFQTDPVIVRAICETTLEDLNNVG